MYLDTKFNRVRKIERFLSDMSDRSHTIMLSVVGALYLIAFGFVIGHVLQKLYYVFF